MEYVYWGWRLESKINLVCGILCKVQLILSVYRIPVTPENDKVRNWIQLLSQAKREIKFNVKNLNREKELQEIAGEGNYCTVPKYI